MKLFCILVALPLVLHAGQPQLKALKATIDPYVSYGANVTNVTIAVYKSTSLGSVWSPWKPTSYFPATRTNTTIFVLAPGTYRFYTIATSPGWSNSVPSNTVTNRQ